MNETIDVEIDVLLLSALTGANAKTTDDAGNEVKVNPIGEPSDRVKRIIVDEFDEA